MTGGGQDCCQHRAGRAFSFGARDVNGGNPLVRASDQRQQHTHPFEFEITRGVSLGLHPLVIDATVEEFKGCGVGLNAGRHERLREASSRTESNLIGDTNLQIDARRNTVVRYRSISPITISSEPTMAGMSAMRIPRQSGPVTDRLQKQELLARARNGSASPSPTT